MKECIPLFVATFAALTSPALADTQLLFQQPTYLDGAAAHFSVTGQVPSYNPQNAWYVHANEPQTYVPVAWNAAKMTGLSVPANAQDWQMGVGQAGHSVAQIYGNSVGAYINSVDLAGQPPLKGFDYSMMIAPEIFWSKPLPIFVRTNSRIEISFREQVPFAQHGAAQGVNTFTKFDLLFIDPTGTRLSMSYGSFIGTFPKQDSVGYDPVSNTVIVAAQLVSQPNDMLGQYATLRPDSAQVQIAPWRGWKHFHFTTNEPQFAAALQAASPIAHSLGKTFSTRPADWRLASTHLNAEIHYTPNEPSMMGWSLQNATIWYQ